MLDPLTLTVLGAGAYWLVKRNPAPPEIAPDVPGDPPPPDDKAETPTTSGGGLPDIAKDLMAKGPIVALGMLYSAAGGAVGKAITGTDLGGAVGTANPIIGNAINIGAKAGGEFDKYLGGVDGGATQATANVGGASVSLAAAFGGALTAVSALSVAAPIYAIASAISDMQELAYGQKGAIAALRKRAIDRKNETIATILSVEPNVNRSELEVWATAYGQALARKDNYKDFDNVMKMSRGIMQSDLSHAIYWRDRGRYVGTAKKNAFTGAVELVETETAGWSDSDAMLAQMKAQEQAKAQQFADTLKTEGIKAAATQAGLPSWMF